MNAVLVLRTEAQEPAEILNIIAQLPVCLCCNTQTDDITSLSCRKHSNSERCARVYKISCKHRAKTVTMNLEGFNSWFSLRIIKWLEVLNYLILFIKVCFLCNVGFPLFIASKCKCDQVE